MEVKNSTLVFMSSTFMLSIEILISTFFSLLPFTPTSLFLIWFANCQKRKKFQIMLYKCSCINGVVIYRYYDLQKGKTNSTKHHEKPLFTILFACKTKIFESIQNSFNIRIFGKNLIVVPTWVRGFSVPPQSPPLQTLQKYWTKGQTCRVCLEKWPKE